MRGNRRDSLCFVSHTRHNGPVAIPLRDRYTTPSRRPRWRWWVGTIVILLLWLVGGSILSLVILPWTGVNPEALFAEGDMFTSFPS